MRIVITHAVEAKAVLRASVVSAEVLEIAEHAVVLKTRAMLGSKSQITSGQTEMLYQRERARVGDAVEGRVRLDVLTDAIFRVRYAEGEGIPEHVTPMVVDTFVGPTQCAIMHTGGQVTVRTASRCILIDLDPYRVVITDLAGEKLCGIGGPEKDHFCQWDSFNTGVCRTLADGAPIAVENFDLAPDECLYGLGEKFIKLNKVGQTIDLMMQDGMGTITPRSYKNVPFFVSTKGYGVFFNTSALMTYWLGSLAATDVQVAAGDDVLDYYVITGSIKEVLSGYTDLTGKGVVPPKWTFGYWQSKFSYRSAEETLEIARQLRAHQISCDVIHLDTHWFKQDWYCDLEFDTERFPDPAGYLRELAEMGFNVSLWQQPYIPEGSALFEELAAVDGFVKCPDGTLYNLRPNDPHCVCVIDYSNPKAVRVHQDWFRKLFRLGVKAIKTDFGEEAPLDGVYHDGTPGEHMRNLYPLLYNKAVFEVTAEVTGEGVVWARSAWAGSQRYPLHWGGDISANWESLVPELEGGLSLGLSGFQFWSHDIGGFLANAKDALLTRWHQFGMFNSHSRNHGAGERELYKSDAETLRLCRDIIQLRYRLMPYIYGSAMDCVERSLPMLRAMVIEYQDDPNVWNLGDQYLFGDSLLVAPIFTPKPTRRVYLPEGVWTDWWTRERIPGGRWISVTASLETMPLYVREGGLIPMGPVMQYVDEFPVEEITLLLAPFSGDGHSTFTIPVNDTMIPVEYIAQGGAHTVVIGSNAVRVLVEPLGEIALTVHIQ